MARYAVPPVDSKNANFAVGDVVDVYGGWHEYA